MKTPRRRLLRSAVAAGLAVQQGPAIRTGAITANNGGVALSAEEQVSRGLPTVSSSDPFRLVGARSRPLESLVEVPLSLCGGAYCITYTIDNQPFRAVVDTGSPFLLVEGARPDGTCGQAANAQRWGCYKGAARGTGLPDTDELFGGEDVGVQWRQGAFALRNASSSGGGLAIDDAIFGRINSYEGKGGGGAVFLGFAKRRLPRIRPTLLEQTGVAALRFDFPGRRMQLSPVPLIGWREDALRLIDLRPRGTPIANYACRVERLVVNGCLVPLDRPCVAVIDTGTTGLSVSEDLYDSGILPVPVREAQIEMRTERGGVAVLEASVRRRRRPYPGVPTIEQPLSAEEYEEFPLVVSPVPVPWFEPGFGEACADGEPFQCDGTPIGTCVPAAPRPPLALWPSPACARHRPRGIQSSPPRLPMPSPK